MGKMATAAVVHEVGGSFSIEQVELDDLRPGEVYIRVEAVGVCHTDTGMQAVVPMPAVLGHEGVGIVEEVGPCVEEVNPGDRVIISWPSCGQCVNCLTAKPYVCESQFPLLFRGCRPDGSHTVKLHGEWISGAFFQQSSFATHAIAPARSLIRVEEDIRPEVLAALPCGVMTGAGSVLISMGATAQDELVIFGAGAVGLSGVMAARLAGVHPIIVVDVNADRLSLALELGATHVVNAATEDVVARVKEIAPAGVRFVLEASGTPSPWKLSAPMLRYGGTFGVAGVPAGETLGENPSEMFTKAIDIKLIMGGSAVPRVFIPKMIEWYQQGRFPVDRLVKTFPFPEINEAFAASHRGEAVKPVLLMS